MFELDDFFKIYFTAPIYGAGHLFSFIVLGVEILTLLLLLKNQHIIYKLMYITCFVMLGKGVYEVIWGYGAFNKISTGDIFLSLVCGLSLIMFNYKTKLLKMNWLFIGMAILQGVIFLLMWQMGWFDAFKLYYVGVGVDPHNLLWAIGKANGQFMWLSLLKLDIRVIPASHEC